MELRLLCFIVLAFIVLSVCEARDYSYGRGSKYGNRGYGERKGYGYRRGSEYNRGTGYSRGYSSSSYGSPYPRCRHSKTKINLVVLEGDGTPVPHTKIDYVDASTMKMNEKWTNNIGVSRLYVSGCEATLIVYSKKGDPTYQEVDLKDCKSGTKKVTVVLKNIGNFLVYINPTESDAYDITGGDEPMYKWKFEHVRYFYQSGSITGEGHAVGGLGAGPLAVRVEDGKDLKLMLTGQTGTIPAYLGLSSLDLSKSAETTMALPPFSVGGTKEFGVVVGCNMADIDVSQDQVGSRPKLFDVFVYYVDRTAASPTVDRLVGFGLDWDCDIDTASDDDHCYTHHFNVSKAEYKTDRDYLFIVEFDTWAENVDTFYRGNCYAIDCNGKIKSTEISSSVSYKPESSGTTPTPVFQIGCICKGKLANYQSLGSIDTYDADSGGSPAPATLDAFYGLCTKCLPAPE